jgi:hypothetical protein
MMLKKGRDWNDIGDRGGNGDGKGCGNYRGGNDNSYANANGDGYNDRGDGSGRGYENPYCTRTCNGDIQFFICQQVMLALTKEK